MRLQCASASPFSNRVPDERAVQGLNPSKGFFFTSRGIRENICHETAVF